MGNVRRRRLMYLVLIIIHGYSAVPNQAVSVVQRLWCIYFITKLLLDTYRRCFTLLAALTVATLEVLTLDAVDVVEPSVPAKTVVGVAVLRLRRTILNAIELLGGSFRYIQ